MMTRYSLGTLAVCFVLLPIIAYGSAYRYFSIPQFMLDYYVTDHSLWLVEADTFAQLRTAAEHEAKKRNQAHLLPIFNKRATVSSNIAFGNWTIKYMPIRPVELVALLPYLQWDGVECKTNPGMIELMGNGQIVQVGGVYSFQIYHYIMDIIGNIEDQGLCVLKAV